MKVDNSAQIRNRIEELKRGKHAVILAHYYTLPEVQEVADFLGDSLALSVKAQSVDAGNHPVRRRAFHGRDRQGALPRQKGAHTLSRGGMLAGRVVRRPRLCGLQGQVPGAYGGFVRQYHGRGQGADRYLLHFVQCPEGRGVDSGRPARSSSHPTATWAPTSRS